MDTYIKVFLAILNYEGLLEVVGSQNVNMNITGVDFPVGYTNADLGYNTDEDPEKVKYANNEKELITALWNCRKMTLRYEFEKVLQQCFDVKYPVTMFDEDYSKKVLKNREELDTFLDQKCSCYQPNFQFPITLDYISESKSVEDFSNYELFEAINSCDVCDIPSFAIRDLPQNNFEITPIYESYDTYTGVFTIDGEVVNDSAVNGVPFVEKLSAGSRYVCFKVYAPDCPEGIETCDYFPVLSNCPNDLAFEIEPLPLNVYRFTPKFTFEDDYSTSF